MDAIKEFYARITVIHLKKKDVVKTSVKGVDIEFDHLKLASILGILGNNGIYEYIKDVWEESKYTKPLEITRRFANNETLTTARRVKSEENEEVPTVVAQDSAQQKVTETAGVDPSGPSGHLPEPEILKLQDEFERTKANRFQADLEKAQAENARLITLLQLAQTKPKP
ncbi:hypothetical protein Dimus_006036 [Dionaea muscipula]